MSENNDVTFLQECARFFRLKSTREREDIAFWANTQNAENLERIADNVKDLSSHPVIAEIAAERRRQIEAEDWSAEHDDQHTEGELARAAATYAGHSAAFRDADERTYRLRAFPAIVAMGS